MRKTVDRVLLDRAIGSIEDIAPEFAHNVAPIYKMLNWKWQDSDRTPTETEILDTIHGLLDTLRTEYDGSQDYPVSTGGLQVRLTAENGLLTANLSFIYDMEEYFEIEE